MAVYRLLRSSISTDCDGYGKLAEIYGRVMNQSLSNGILDLIIG